MRQILAVVRYNFMGFFKSSKVIFSFLLGFVLCYLLSSQVMTVIEAYQTPVQAAEPFLWTFGDTTAILLSSLLLMLLFSDLPKMSPASPYQLLRMTKKKWLAGQFCYVILVTALYTGIMMAFTVVLCMKNSYVGDIWSETAAMLGYSKLGEQMQVPSTVKVMESTLPYSCMCQVLLLIFFYALTLSFVILAGNLILGKNGGIIIGLLYSLYGFLLKPEVLGKLLHMEQYEMYKINVLVAWISPLSHASYARHNFGYDTLPTVSQSCMVFGGLLVFLILVCCRSLRRYPFQFTGGSTS
ncbi:MAG: hypothetical protein PHE06_08695 [Lachnospiraceae bacterium]|nr:hypothetical protein [Lachnospiraceae bacterium]